MFFIEQIRYIAKNKDDKKHIKELVIGFSICIIGLMILILTLMGSTSVNKGISISFDFDSKLAIIFLMKMAINLLGNTLNNVSIVALFYTIIMIIFLYQIYKHPKSGIIGITAFIWQWIVFLFIYSDFSTQKTNTFFLILIFIAWINLDENEIKINNKINIMFEFIITFFCTFVLLVSDINGLQYIKKEITKKYSDSISVAEFINNNLESDAIFLCTNEPRASAIIPYIKNAVFINPVKGEEFTYVTWDETAFKILDISEIIESIKENNYNGKTIYLIVSIFSNNDKEKREIKKFQKENVLSEVLYESDIKNIIIDEAYKIYKINL